MSHKAKILANEFWKLMHSCGFISEEEFINKFDMRNPTHQKIYSTRLAFYSELASMVGL